METLQRIARMNRSFLPAGRLVEPAAVSHHFLFGLVGVSAVAAATSASNRVCVCVFQRERGSWRFLLNSSFRRTSLLLWFSW